MKCSEFVRKHTTIKTLGELSEITGIQVRTLQNWYNDNKKAFVSILVGAYCEKESLLNVSYFRNEINLY